MLIYSVIYLGILSAILLFRVYLISKYRMRALRYAFSLVHAAAYVLDAQRVNDIWNAWFTQPSLAIQIWMLHNWTYEDFYSDFFRPYGGF